MARRLTYIPNRVIDTNGISDGASIYVYQSGTTTLVSLYSDVSLTTPIANPYVVPAGAAVPEIYHEHTGNIRVRIVAAGGAVVSDDDPYQAPVSDIDLASTDTGKGAALVGFQQDGAAAVTRTTASKLKEIVSILDYIPEEEHEAIKNETSTYDCAAAFQSAVDEARTIIVPNGKYIVNSATVREATNGGARNIVGQNRLYSKVVAGATLAASGGPIFWFGNSNGHGNYRLRFQNLYLDGGGTNANRGSDGAIGLRAHECGTSFIGDLYIARCIRAIDAIGCIGYSFGGERTEFYYCQEGLWHTAPTGGAASGSTGGNSLTTTESFLSLNDNINHIQNLWFSGVNKPIRCTGGLTQIDHVILQSCGGGATDDLIHLIDANESYDYGAGPDVTHVWMEGGSYRSVIRVEHTRQASIRKCFFSGSGANCEQAIIVKNSSGTILAENSFRGSWSRTPSEGRTTNASYYVHGDSRNGFYGPNYHTQATVNPKIEYTAAGHNNIVIENHNAGNSDKGLTVGNVRISTSSGSTIMDTNPDALADLGAVNWYLRNAISLDSFRSTGYVRADTEFRVGSTKVVGARQSAIPNAASGTEVATINAILSAMRAHGLIAP